MIGVSVLFAGNKLLRCAVLPSEAHGLALFFRPTVITVMEGRSSQHSPCVFRGALLAAVVAAMPKG
jgi:hypothetical protein